MSNPSTASTPYPGSRLGLPGDGPGSVASWGRRLLALLVDWLACSGVSRLLVGDNGLVWDVSDLLPMGLFLLEATVLTALLGGSFGQLLLRVTVVRLDSRPVQLLPALARTALICLVVPPLIFNRDNRGLHDLAFGTITLRR